MELQTPRFRKKISLQQFAARYGPCLTKVLKAVHALQLAPSPGGRYSPEVVARALRALDTPPDTDRGTVSVAQAASLLGLRAATLCKYLDHPDAPEYLHPIRPALTDTLGRECRLVKSSVIAFQEQQRLRLQAMKRAEEQPW